MPKFLSFFLAQCIFTISVAQNVGINQDNPVNVLDVNGNISVGSNYTGVSTAPADGAIIEGATGVGTSTPATSAMLDVVSTTKGMLIPRMTTVQRNAISAPATGLLVYDLTSNSFWFHDGTTWTELVTSGIDSDDQDLSLAGNTLSLTNDLTTVDLSGFLDNTDSQTLSFTNPNLSISGGNSVDLSSLSSNDGDWTINGAEMYNANSGDIGIGTQSPDAQLHLAKSNSASTLQVETAINGGLSGGSVANFRRSQGTLAAPADAPISVGSTYGSLGDLGAIQWQGLKGGVYRNAAAIVGRTKSTSTGIVRGEIGFWTSTGVAGGMEERMRLTDDGELGIGTANPGGKLHVMGDVYTTGGGYNFTPPAGGGADLAFYRGGTGFHIIRRFDTSYTVLQIWSPPNSFNAEEATLALVRGDEPNQEYIDIYNNGYSSETQFGIRMQRRGTGSYRDFVYDYYDGSTKSEVMRLTPALNVGIGTASPTEKLQVHGKIHIQHPGGPEDNLFEVRAFDHEFPVFKIGATDPAPGFGNLQLLDAATNTTTVLLTAEPGRFSFINNPGARLGVGITAPDAPLHVLGSVKIVDGTQGAGKVLTSDAAGLASWQTPSGGADSDWTISGNNLISGVTGNVGLGVNSPTDKLSVSGTVSMDSLARRNFTTGSNAIMMQGKTNSQHWINFKADGSTNDETGVIFSEDLNNHFFMWNDAETLRVAHSVQNSDAPDVSSGTQVLKLGAQGDMELPEGWLSVGGGSTASQTRQASQTFIVNTTYQAVTDTLKFLIGTLTMPTNATNRQITMITYDLLAHHTDIDEVHGTWLSIDTNSNAQLAHTVGVTNASGGYLAKDWNHSTNDMGVPFIGSPTLWLYMHDEDETVGTEGSFNINRTRVTIHYQYQIALEDGDIQATGRIYANTSQEVGDLAEYFPVRNGNAVGMIVSYEPGSDNSYKLADQAYNDHIVGVISENPSVVLNSPDAGAAVGMTGRVKVKVVPSKSLIKGGDYITTSEYPGFGQRATRPGKVVGYAITNQKPGEDWVEILLQPGTFYTGSEKVSKSPDQFSDRPATLKSSATPR